MTPDEFKTYYQQIIKDGSPVRGPVPRSRMTSGIPNNVYEMTKKYTLDLKEHFTLDATTKVPPGLPNRFRRNLRLLRRIRKHVAELPRKEWEYALLEKGGVLTIKKGYRWDGISMEQAPKMIQQRCMPNPAIKGMRASLVHDALYDLMRLKLLKQDKPYKSLTDEGHKNRLMTDALLYAIGAEDGWATSKVQRSYNWLRIGGANRTRSKMPKWKY